MLTMDNDFPIFFSDLTQEAQKRLMKAVGIETPSDMNWDIDMCPLAYYPIDEPIVADA